VRRESHRMETSTTPRRLPDLLSRSDVPKAQVMRIATAPSKGFAVRRISDTPAATPLQLAETTSRLAALDIQELNLGPCSDRCHGLAVRGKRHGDNVSRLVSGLKWMHRFPACEVPKPDEPTATLGD